MLRKVNNTLVLLKRKMDKKMEEKNRRNLMTASDTKRRRGRNSKIEIRGKKNS